MTSFTRAIHNTGDLTGLFEDFKQLEVMVVGDVMIDAYVFGTVDRISPEAPVPVVAVKERISRLGGAANVALNIHALGARPVLVSVIGNDSRAGEFIQLLDKENLAVEGIIQSKERPTTTKFRIIGNRVQMLRVDEEITSDIGDDEAEELLQRAEKLLKSGNIGVIILQDYNKGVLTESVIRQMMQLAARFGVPVAVDPKKKYFHAYKGASLFKPNLKELKDGLGLSFDASSISSITAALQELQHQLDVKLAMATLSEKGVLISEKMENQDAGVLYIPAHLRNIADVSGAGDTVISVASLCLALGLTPGWLAEMSNLAGGLVCEEIGVVPVDKNKLLAEAFKVYTARQKGQD